MSRQRYATIPRVSAKLIALEARWQRLLLLVPAALIIFSAYFITRWYLGDTLAQYAPNIETGQLAARLSPADPQAHYTLAVFNEQTLSPQALTEAVSEYERAASLAPDDYRLWQALGRVRERAGDAAGSEQALRRAVELAPFYANPRWLLGNLLLRQGRIDEAFAELRRASDALPSLRPQLFYLAWTVYDGDVSQVKAALGDAPATRALLIELLLKQERANEALALWDTFDAGQKREQFQAGDALRQALFKLKRFRDALRVSQEAAPQNAEQKLAPGEIANAGFEQDISLSGQEPFGWQVVQAAEPAISIDRSHAHSGSRSLLLTFNSPTGREFNNVSQLVLVEPNASYRLVYYVRMEELKSASTLVMEVSDAVESGRPLVVSAPLAVGTHEWQAVTLDFNTLPQAEAVIVRLARVPCSDSVCPIFGKIWYDDFSLQRLTGSARDTGGAGHSERAAQRN